MEKSCSSHPIKFISLKFVQKIANSDIPEALWLIICVIIAVIRNAYIEIGIIVDDAKSYAVRFRPHNIFKGEDTENWNDQHSN